MMFLSDMSYSSGYTETANTSFSSIFKSGPIHHSLKQRINTTIYCSLKRARVTSPALFWKVKKFLNFEALRAAAQKRRRAQNKTLGAALFLCAAACFCRCSVLSENNLKKRSWLRKKRSVDKMCKMCHCCHIVSFIAYLLDSHYTTQPLGRNFTWSTKSLTINYWPSINHAHP